MIRRSAFVALVAILVSLLLHIWGLSLTSAGLPQQPASSAGPGDTVAVSNTFEDLAEAPPEPIQPESAEVPEPPVETPPEPEQADVPTSQALVASPDPQQSFAPDTGTSAGLVPEAPELEVTESVDQSDTNDAASDDTDATPPVEPDTVAAAPPETSIEPVEVETAETPPVPEPEQLAALPPPEPTVVPVPSEQDAPDADIPDNAVEPEAQAEPDAETDGTSEQAVAASIRPRPREQRPTDQTQPSLDNFSNFDNLRYPEQVIDSPLRAYQREGIDNFTRRTRGNRSGGRGPGNSDTTNYAGQVLVHLNRAPVVYVPVPGYAQVFFEISPDGSLAWVDVVTSSGSDRVNRAAKEQVRRAAPFPRPPGGVSRKLSFYYQND
ncbi:MAG: TonB family protein [Pseudomonadota bacterium]